MRESAVGGGGLYEALRWCAFIAGALGVPCSHRARANERDASRGASRAPHPLPPALCHSSPRSEPVQRPDRRTQALSPESESLKPRPRFAVPLAAGSPAAKSPAASASTSPPAHLVAPSNCQDPETTRAPRERIPAEPKRPPAASRRHSSPASAFRAAAVQTQPTRLDPISRERELATSCMAHQVRRSYHPVIPLTPR